MRDVVPELNDARRNLKSAMAESVPHGEATQRRIAEILRKAAEEIRAAAPEAGPNDIDL